MGFSYKFMLVCLLLIVSSMGCSKATEFSPISADELFKASDTYSYKLNPSSEYIAKHYFRGKEYNVIEIHDAKNGRKADAFRLKVKKYAFIQKFYWVDDNTLYISYRLGEKKYKRIFLDINYEVFQKSENEIATIREIKSKAKIIDPLIYRDNLVLVQHYAKKRYDVYTANTESVQQGKFDKADKFTHTLESALGYFTGSNGLVQFTATLEDEKLKFWYLENYQSQWKELFEFGEFDFEFEPVAIIDDSKMVVITDKDTDKKSLVEFNYTTKTFNKVLYQHGKYDIISASIDELTGRVSSVSYFDHGRLQTEYFSNENKNVDKLIKRKFPEKQYVIHSKHDRSPKMMLLVFSAFDPGSYYLFNSATNQFKYFGASRSYLEKYKFSSTEIFSVKSENNIEIEAILTKPKKSNGVLLVEPHGGPVGVRNLDIFSSSNQFYASRGYTILNVNFRGSEGYGKKFLSEGKGQFGKKIEQDISLVVKKVKQKYTFSSTCAMGSSYGGYSAVMLSAYHPNEYDCVIGAYGVYDLPLLFNTSNMQMLKSNIEAVSNTVGEYNDRLIDFSPVYIAEKLTMPILLIAGKEDFVSGLEQSNRMKYRLEQLHKDVESIFYARTGHGHQSFFWEQHEHILIENFIRRKLNLGEIATDNKELLGLEAMKLADAFEFKDLVENQPDKAFSFYNVAANNKHPRGLYNLGSFYHRGHVVDKDITKAVSLYQESSAIGYEDASYRLGEMYWEGKLVGKEMDKSYHYFQLAKEQGHKYAFHKIVRAKCLGWGVERDFDACLKYITEQLGSNGTRVLKTIKDIVFYSSISKKETRQLSKVLKENKYLNVPDRQAFEIEDYGLFEYSKFFKKYRHEETGHKFDLGDKQKIGISYQIDYEPEDINSRAIFKVTWHHPPYADGTTDTKKGKIESLHWVKFEKDHRLMIKFDKDWERVSGEWKVEVQSLDNELLFSQVFDLTFVDDK